MKDTFMLLLLFVLATKTLAQTKTIKTYHANGKTESIKYIKVDKTIRILLFWPYGKIKKEVNLKDNELFGLQVDYDSLGRKVTKSFVIGVNTIPYKLINDTASNDFFVDVISSKQTNYFSNGKKKSEGYIVNACMAGLWTYYNDDGTISETKFYKTLRKNE